jgi:hypothetical protein
MSPDEVVALEKRVANGISWLSEHDPVGAFYAWWQAGLTPLSLLPAHEATPEVRVQWTAWYNAKLVYDKLDKKLAYAEERGYRPLAWPIGWTPAKAVRP